MRTSGSVDRPRDEYLALTHLDDVRGTGVSERRSDKR
jgi:hypothetical protein